MKKINLNQLTSQELAKLEQLADHSYFWCRNCGNERTSIKCFKAKELEELEKTRQIICQQPIKRVGSCRNLHVENECLAYSGQHCWNNCDLDQENSSKVCLKHWNNLKKKS